MHYFTLDSCVSLVNKAVSIYQKLKYTHNTKSSEVPLHSTSDTVDFQSHNVIWRNFCIVLSKQSPAGNLPSAAFYINICWSCPRTDVHYFLMFIKNIDYFLWSCFFRVWHILDDICKAAFYLLKTEGFTNWFYKTKINLRSNGFLFFVRFFPNYVHTIHANQTSVILSCSLQFDEKARQLNKSPIIFIFHHVLPLMHFWTHNV